MIMRRQGSHPHHFLHMMMKHCIQPAPVSGRVSSFEAHCVGLSPGPFGIENREIQVMVPTKKCVGNDPCC